MGEELRQILLGIQKTDTADFSIGGEVEHGEFAVFGRVTVEQMLIIAEQDAVGVFLHLGQGEHATDAGHAVDVGEEDGVVGWQEGGSPLLEIAVGVLAGAHGETNDDVAEPFGG